MVPPILMTAILTLSLSSRLQSQTIYATEFEEFNVGNEMLKGEDFWQIGTSSGTGSYGIDSNLVSGLGKSAFLGYNQPATPLVTVAVAHFFDPIASKQPLIEFESILGVEDSTNGNRDTFSVIFLSANGGLLASIELRNSNTTFGLWYSDGVKIRDSNIDFLRGELHLLTAQINFERNTWSAQLDGVDLFDNITFHSGSETLNLGFTGAQWHLTSPLLSGFGNNFLLIADWYLYSIPTDDFQISSVSRIDGQDILRFPTKPGFVYTLESSSDLVNWNSEAASSHVLQPAPPGEQAFTVENPSAKKFYRVLRDFSPAPTK